MKDGGGAGGWRIAARYREATLKTECLGIGGIALRRYNLSEWVSHEPSTLEFKCI